MSFSENTSESDWKETKSTVVKAIKQEPNRSKNSQSKIKYSQKFCDKWLNIFTPWLSRSPKDTNKPFCRACQCLLDCNRCHLQRHERTTKHQRNLDILLSKGEVAARQNLSIRQERSKYYLQRKKAVFERSSREFTDGNHTAEEEGQDDNSSDPPKDFKLSRTVSIEKTEPELKHEVTTTDDSVQLSNVKCIRDSVLKVRSSAKKNSVVKKEGLKLLMQIHKDKNELVDSIKEIMSTGGQFQQSPHKEKNHIDLFFESVSSSVKCFSPKLIAEAKMRVSQLIGELELRSLTETSNTIVPVYPDNGYGTALTNASSSHTFVINQNPPPTESQNKPLS